jgi:hypothetical protein
MIRFTMGCTNCHEVPCVIHYYDEMVYHSHIFLDKGTRFWPLSKYTFSKLLHNSAVHAEARETVYLSHVDSAY